MSINNKFNFLYQNDLRKIFTAIFSQGMLSVSNFAISIIMAKYTTKSEYGMYVILFSFIGILKAYQNAIINAPLMDLVNLTNASEKRTYISSLATGNFYIFIPLLFLLVITVVMYSVINNSPSSYIIVAVVVSTVTMIFLSKEFVRTLLFVNMNINAVFIMDVLNTVTIFIGLTLLVYIDKISSLTAIVVLGSGYFVANIFAQRKNLYCSEKNNKSIKKALKENWNHGKWVFMGVTASLLQDRGYVYIVSIVLGLEALADVSAARLFMMPIGLLIMSSPKILVAKGSKMLSLNKNYEFRKFVFSFISTLLIVWFFYSLLIMLTSNLIIGFLGEKYINTKELIFIWSIFFFVNSIRFQMGAALLVYRKFKEMSLIDIWGLTFSITSCFLLVYTIGRSGAIVSIIIGEVVTLILYMKLYLRLKQYGVTKSAPGLMYQGI